MSVDRHAAAAFKEKGVADTQGAYTLFGQLFRSINGVDPRKLRNGKQPLSVEFRGEFGDDVGGLFRETFTEISKEIESPLLPQRRGKEPRRVCSEPDGNDSDLHRHV